MLVELDGVAVPSVDAVHKRLDRTTIGRPLPVTVWLRGGEIVRLVVTPEVPPAG